jgi:predicted HicB family RNase H-like nuclease
VLNYKGYAGIIKFDAEAGILRGQVPALRDVITFQGQTVPEVIQAFHDSVDDYLEFCEKRGEHPERPFSGNLLVRLKPEVHRALTIKAIECGVSVNRLVSGHLANLARRTGGSKASRSVSPAVKAQESSKAVKAQESSKAVKSGGKAGKSSVKSGGKASKSSVESGGTAST